LSFRGRLERQEHLNRISQQHCFVLNAFKS
jgi:hypothetical protein